MSKRKSGRFSLAVSAAIEAKDADHAFQAYLPPPLPTNTVPEPAPVISPVNKSTNSNNLYIPPYEHEESYTYGMKRSTTQVAQAQMSPINTENNSAIQTASPSKQSIQKTNEVISSSEKSTDVKITQEYSIYDIILLKQLNVLEKSIVAVVLLSFVAMQVYNHSLYDIVSLGHEAFLSQSYTLFVHLRDHYFTGLAGVKTIASIVLGTALSLFFDAKPVEFDRLCYQSLQTALQPVVALLQSLGQRLLRVFSIVRSIVSLWGHTPRIVKYLCVLLIGLSLTRQAVIAVYVNVFVAHGDTIAKAGGFLLILLVFVCLGVAGYGIVYARNALLTRKRVAVEAVTEAVILYLHNLGHPEPISNIHRTLVSLEETQRTFPSSNGAEDTAKTQQGGSGKHLALFFSPSGKQVSSAAVSSSVVPLSLPAEVWHVSMQKIWPEIVRLVSKDNRVRTTMRHVNGKNEQCWTYIAATHVSVGVVSK